MDFYHGKRVCVALSGGADSVCLLHFFKTRAQSFDITLSAVHIEHGIRGEDSLSDMRFCKALCSEWGIPLKVVCESVPEIAENTKTGLEEAGRIVRYRVFQEELSRGACDLIATAHNKNDVAETILFRLARGTALSGMKAIVERRGIVRPLIGVTRAQIEAYIAENNLPHIEDATNLDEKFTRNYIRRNVLPVFEQIANNAADHLVHFAALAAEDDDHLYSLARKEIISVQGDAGVPISLPMPLFLRACLICMGAGKDYTGAQLNAIAKLKNLQSGKKVSLSGGMEAVREYENIVFYRPSTPMPSAPFCVEFGGMISKKPIEGGLMVDLDAFPAGCVIRARREGDFIVPFGGQRKPLKKFLTDKKISARIGRELPLIANESEVLVVVGVEISDKVKVTKDTKRVGYLGRRATR